jgi:hypothetical protein
LPLKTAKTVLPLDSPAPIVASSGGRNWFLALVATVFETNPRPGGRIWLGQKDWHVSGYSRIARIVSDPEVSPGMNQLTV